MDDDVVRASKTEKALDERVRQAEARIGAQVTFLAATYHRTAVLAGVVFAIVVALFGITYTDLVDSLIIDIMRPLSLLAIAPLLLLVFATALTKASFPGAMDILHEGADATELKEALLDSYRVSFKWNQWRLAASRFMIVSVAVTFGLMGGALFYFGHEQYQLREFVSNPELTARAWEDQSGPVQRYFTRITPSLTDEERVAVWNRYTPDQRLAFFTQTLPATSGGGPITVQRSSPTSEGSNDSGASDGVAIGRGHIDNRAGER